MLLADRIDIIDNMRIGRELDELLKKDNFSVSITCLGQRIVFMDDYKGFVAVDVIATKYLKAMPFRSVKCRDLEERWVCYQQWGKIKWLYEASEEALQRSPFIYRFFNWIGEFNVEPSPKDYFLDPCESRKNDLLTFDKSVLREIFPPAAEWMSSSPFDEDTFQVSEDEFHEIYPLTKSIYSSFTHF